MPEAREFRSNRPQEFALTGLGICVGAAAWPGRHAPGSSRGATAGPRICRSVPAFDLGPLQFGNQACLLELHNGTSTWRTRTAVRVRLLLQVWNPNGTPS
jgi:hypothetical protein